MALVLLSFATCAFAATDIIPCEVGNKWQYDCYKVIRGQVTFKGKQMGSMDSSSFGSSVYEVLSVDGKSAQPIYSYRETTDTSSEGSEPDHDQTDLQIRNDATGQYILSSYRTGSGMDAPDKQQYDKPLLYYVRGATPGKEWIIGVMRDEDTQVPMSAKAVGRETVTVPAGTFKNCLKVVYTSDTMSGTVDIWKKQFNITAGKSRGIYWVAEGVGVVKELEIATSTAQTPGPDGTPVSIESSSCSVSELRPGFKVK